MTTSYGAQTTASRTLGGNFDASDPNNPLLAILGGRGMMGSTGFNVSGAFSTLGMGGGGFSSENGDAAGPGRVTPEQMAMLRSLGLTTDTQMESPVTSFDGRTINDNGTTYQVDPTGDIRINGDLYSQLNGLNVGGPGGVIDPSQVTYDPRFGLVTKPTNINNIFDTGYGNGVFAAGALGLALPTIAAAMGGAAGSSGGVASTDAAESGGTLGLNAAGTGVTPYVPTPLEAAGTAGAPAGGGGSGAGAPVSEGSTPIPGADPGTGSSLGNAGSTFNRFRSALGLANSLMGGNSSGSHGMDIGSLLGLLGIGHQMFGGGIGTASGAQAAGDRAADRADPYASRRQDFISQLTPERVNALLNPDPSAVLSDPGFQFARNQGINAINMGDAAQGTLRSGNRLTELEQFGTGLASQYEQQFRNNNFTSLSALAQLAGVNAGSPAAAGQMLMGGFDNASNLRNAGGNALFSGGSNNPLGSILGLLGNAGGSLLNGAGDFFGSIFGSDGGTVSDDLFPGFVDDGSGGNIFDALAGP